MHDHNITTWGNLSNSVERIKIDIDYSVKITVIKVIVTYRLLKYLKFEIREKKVIHRSTGAGLVISKSGGTSLHILCVSVVVDEIGILIPGTIIMPSPFSPLTGRPVANMVVVPTRPVVAVDTVRAVIPKSGPRFSVISPHGATAFGSCWDRSTRAGTASKILVLQRRHRYMYVQYM